MIAGTPKQTFGTPVQLAEVFEQLVDEQTPVGFRAYDGSVAGPPDPEAVVEIRSPDAISYMVREPNDLGMARAYVTGALDVRGNLYDAAHGLATHARELEWTKLLRTLPAFGRQLLRRPGIPPEEAPAPWRRGLIRHSKRRDADAIAHHYDVSNAFYELVLGPSMAYSCAVFSEPDTTLDDAQAEKFDLVARKLDLQPGQRLLDVGAGWGGMIIHAARNYGVHATGVTLSQRQVEWARRRIAEQGLEDRVEIRLLDYRDVPESGFDAISSIGAMEHIGSAQLGAYFAWMSRRLRPEGRLLNHTITRATNRARHRTGKFIDRYVFPDGELQGPGTVIGKMHDHGLELRHDENLREHYAKTLGEWCANLDRNWDAAVAEVGERRARVWRLYMTMSRIAFEQNRVEIHQMLGVRLTAEGRAGMPLRPRWERAATFT